METHNYRIIPRQPKARSDKGTFPLLPSQTRLYYSFKVVFVERSIDDVEEAGEENETPQGRNKKMKRAEVLFSVEGRFSQFVKFRQQVAEKFPHLPLPELTDTNPHNIGLPSDQEQADRKRRIAIMLHVVANGLPTTPASREIPNESAAAAGQRRRRDNNNNPPIMKSPDTVPVDFLEKMLSSRNEENSNNSTGAENDRDHPNQETIDMNHKFDLSSIAKTSNVWESEEKFTRSLIVQLKNLEQHFTDMLKGIEVEASAHLASFSLHAQEIVRICQGKGEQDEEEEDGNDFNVTEIPEDGDDDQEGNGFNGESSNGNTINGRSTQQQEQAEQQEQVEEIDRETSVSSANSSSSLPPLETTPFPTSAGAAAAAITPTARQQQDDVDDDIDDGENHQQEQQEQEQQRETTAKKNDKPLDKQDQILIFGFLQQRASGIRKVLDQINLLLQFLNGVHNLACARSKEWCQLYRLIRDADEYYTSSVRGNTNNNDDPRSEDNTNEVPINVLVSYLNKLAGSTSSFTSSSSSASAAAGDTISNFLSNTFSSERRNASSYFSELHRREQQKQQEKDNKKEKENNNSTDPGASPNNNNNNQNTNQHQHQHENNNNNNNTHCSPSTLSPDSVEFRLISIIKRSSNALEKLYQDSYTPMRRFVLDDLYASLMVMIREALTKKLQRE